MQCGHSLQRMVTTIITSYCSIRNNEIIIDGVRESAAPPDHSLDALLHAVYTEKKINYPKFFKMDSLCKLAFIAVELLKIPGAHTGGTPAADVGVVLSNSASSLDTDGKYHESIADRKHYFPSPALFVYTLPNIMIGELCIRHKWGGENCFFVSRQFDPAMLAAYVGQLFASGAVRSCVTGWVDVQDGTYDAILFYVEQTGAADNKLLFSADALLQLYKGEGA